MAANYWAKLTQQRVRRRRFVVSASGGLAGIAFIAACGGDDSPTPTGATGGVPTGGATGATGGTGAGSLLAMPEDTTASAVTGGVLTTARNADITTFDGQNSSRTFPASVLFSRLLRVTPGYMEPARFDFTGDLIDSWEFSPDRLSLTMKLRETSWHDVAPVNGRRVDAEDIQVGWERWEAKGVARGNFAASVNPDAPIESITATDEQTVVVRLNRPVSSVLGLLATNAGGMYMTPKEADHGYDPAQVAIGSGPYALKDYTPSVDVALARNPGHYDADRVYIEESREVIMPEYAAGMAQFRAGAILAFGLTQEDVLPTKRDLSQLNLYAEEPPFQFGILKFGYDPSFDTPFRDKRLRQAVALSIDRELWLEVFHNVGAFEAAGIPLESYLHSAVQANTGGIYAGRDDYWLPPDSDSFGPTSRYFQFDLDEAHRLVEAAGYPDGVDTSASVGTFSGHTREVEVLVNFASEAGIRLNLTVYENTTEFRERFADVPGTFDGVAFRLRQAGGIFDPVEVAYQEYVPHPGPSYPGFFADGLNYMDGDPEYTRILEAAREEFDIDQRRELMYEFQRLEAENQYMPAFPGTAQLLRLYWPALRNVNVFSQELPRGSTAAPPLSLMGVWLDPTQPPLARS